MELSEFIKSVNFGSNMKKTAYKKWKNLILHLKIDFFKWKNIFLIYNKLDSDRSELDLSDETVRNSNFVKSYDEKTTENNRNCYITDKRIDSKLSKISILNFDSTNFRLE